MTANIKFKDRVIDGFGDRGRAWLSGLPDLLNDLASAWRLTLAQPVRDLNVNYPEPIEASAPHFRDRISILSEELEDDRIHMWAMIDIVQCLCSTIGEREDDWKRFLMHAARFAAQYMN